MGKHLFKASKTDSEIMPIEVQLSPVVEKLIRYTCGVIIVLKQNVSVFYRTVDFYR